jgi:hypothetical protein
MRTFFAFLLLPAMVAVASDQQSVKMNGWISDSLCAQEHSGAAPNVACVKQCIEGGARPVFVDDAKKQVWKIDNPTMVTGHYGHHVAVTAFKDRSSKSFHINKLSMLSEPQLEGAHK